MDIFDGLHPQCADSIDVEKSDSSEDSDVEVIEQLIEPAEADLAFSVPRFCLACVQGGSYF